MLTQLSLTNFKSWKEIERMDFAPITGLFGTNSSGKTSILQLLLMLKQTVESPDRAQALIFGDERSPADLGAFSDIIHKHDLASSLTWALDWRLPKRLTVSDLETPEDTLFEGNELRFEAELKADDG
ncbi:MAG: AAA family ATPase, partial [Planctomycetes bacterium]|nr:AAA family ATPase [Planctomycetota bacterium]